MYAFGYLFMLLIVYLLKSIKHTYPNRNCIQICNVYESESSKYQINFYMNLKKYMEMKKNTLNLQWKPAVKYIILSGISHCFLKIGITCYFI